MNLILLEEADFLGPSTARLTGPRLQHLLLVLKAQLGDSIKVGRINGNKGSARIADLNGDQALLDCIQLDLQPPAKLPLTVILALPRPKAARRICRTVAELGAEKLILINSFRVEKSYWQSPLLSESNILRYFVEGLQQAGDTVIPSLTFAKRFKPFVEDVLPTLAANTRALVAHPDPAAAKPVQDSTRTLIAIGPEGGFIPYEIDKLQASGLGMVQLGERILKVETAVPTLIARLFI